MGGGGVYLKLYKKDIRFGIYGLIGVPVLKIGFIGFIGSSSLEMIHFPQLWFLTRLLHSR